MTAPSRLLPWVATVCLGAGACGEGEAALEERRIEDWAAETVLRIGSLDDPETSLTLVSDVLSHEDGRIYLGQPQDGLVRIHGLQGELLGRFGRRGEGPGDFSDNGPSAMGWWGEGTDTLWTYDQGLRRVSLFLADGTFVRSTQLTNPPYLGVMRVAVQGVTPQGMALGVPSFASRLLASGEIRSVPVLRFSLDDAAPEVVVETSTENRQLALEFGTGMSFSSQPFGDAPLTATSGRAGRVVVVDRSAASDAAGARFRVTAVAVAGDTLWSRDYPYAPIAIPEAELDSVRAALIERSIDFATRMGASRADVERQVAAELYLPSFRVPVTAARVWDDGSVWLQLRTEPEAGVNRWLALAPDGEPVGRLEVPENVRIRAVEGTRAWAVETDALDVPYVVALRVGPDPG